MLRPYRTNLTTSPRKTKPQMKKISRRLHVIENRRISPDVFVLTLGSDVALPEIKPGQFAAVLVENTNDVFLRRPFSIHDVDPTHNFIKFYIQIVGKGTEQLSKLTSRDSVDVIFPLGNGFSIENGKLIIDDVACAYSDGGQPNYPLSIINSPLLIGGGCGVAPLLYLAKKIDESGIRPTVLIGGRSKKNILCIEEYVKYGNVLITTEDGSLGEKGFVTDHPIFHNGKFDQIYCCGPEPMMHAVAKFAIENRIPCQISLENMMACGIGACLCCVTQTIEGHQCVCTEGPVFNANELRTKS